MIITICTDYHVDFSEVMYFFGLGEKNQSLLLYSLDLDISEICLSVYKRRSRSGDHNRIYVGKDFVRNNTSFSLYAVIVDYQEIEI